MAALAESSAGKPKAQEVWKAAGMTWESLEEDETKIQDIIKNNVRLFRTP